MEGPLVLVVRETSSLADSVQLLLETVGYRVVPESRVSAALARLGDPREERVRAVVIACNQPTSELLHGYPDSFPSEARGLPTLVVGDRVADTRRAWPPNVQFLRLPVEANRLVDQLEQMIARSAKFGPAAVPAIP